jgi:hypothetical protein
MVSPVELKPPPGGVVRAAPSGFMAPLPKIGADSRPCSGEGGLVPKERLRALFAGLAEGLLDSRPLSGEADLVPNDRQGGLLAGLAEGLAGTPNANAGVLAVPKVRGSEGLVPGFTPKPKPPGLAVRFLPPPKAGVLDNCEEVCWKKLPAPKLGVLWFAELCEAVWNPPKVVRREGELVLEGVWLAPKLNAPAGAGEVEATPAPA